MNGRPRRSMRFSLLLLVSAAAAAAAPIEVYLIAGQSNATGQGYVRNLPAGFVIDPAVEIFHSGPPHLRGEGPAETWHPLAPASESPDRFGPELTFGARLRALRPGVRIALIKHARSGTNLHRQWWPGSSAADRSDWGPHYAEFVRVVEAGLAALRARGDEPVLAGWFWSQGEADAKPDGDVAALYGERLAWLVARVRNQFGAPNLPVAIAQIAPAEEPARERVRAAQRRATGAQVADASLKIPGARLVLTDDLPRRADDPASPYPNDREHLGSAGVLIVGERAAEALAGAGDLSHSQPAAP